MIAELLYIFIYEYMAFNTQDQIVHEVLFYHWTDERLFIYFWTVVILSWMTGYIIVSERNAELFIQGLNIILKWYLHVFCFTFCLLIKCNFFIKHEL